MVRTHGTAALAQSLASCSGQSPGSKHPEAFETLELRYEGSASNVTYSELAEDLGDRAPVKLTYLGNNSTGGRTADHWKSTGIPTDHGELRDKDFQLRVNWLGADAQLTPGQLALSDIYTNALHADVRATARRE